MITEMTGKDEMDEKMKKMQDMTGNKFDLHFLNMVQMHHQQAIDMSNMALKKSGSEDVKKLAQRMIDEQQSEIEEIEQMKKGIE